MAKGWSFGALIAALKGAAFLNVGTVANTVAAGDDRRITGAAQKGNNLADLTDYAKARNQLSAAYIYGDTNVKFWALDSPGDSNSVVTMGRLNTVANTKANLQGDSNVDFYCRNINTGPITAGGNVSVAWGGRGHAYQENGDIVRITGGTSIFSVTGSTNLSGSLNWLVNRANDAWNKAQDAQDNRAQWTRTGARRDFGQISRNNDKWLDDGWVVIGAGARDNEKIQNLVLLGGRLQIYRTNGGWVDFAT